mgnify:CR=1 FL=1
MKHRKISIKLTEEQFLLLHTYQLQLLEISGENKSKQQIIMELLLPILNITEYAFSYGGEE